MSDREAKAMTQPSPASTGENATAHSLEDQIRVIEQRLRKGEEVVRSMKESGGDHEMLTRLELGWMKLLRQYEILCDRLERQSGHRRPSDASGSPEEG